MNFKFTLVLLAAAIVAVVGFGLAQRQVPPSAGSSSASPSAVATAVLTDFGPGTVTGLDIKTKDHETSLTKNGAAWQLVKPAEDPNVDQTKINRLVGQLTALTSQRPVAKSSDDITPFGLRNPSTTVVLTGGSKTETLLIGDKNVDGNYYYAMRQDGSDVALIPSSLVDSISSMATTPPRATPTPSRAASASASAAVTAPLASPSA